MTRVQPASSLPGVRCVVFDVDDTLYMEETYARTGFAAVGIWARDHLGVDDVAERAWALFEAGARGDIFDRLLSELDRVDDRDAIRQMVSTYRNHQPDICLLDDVLACLCELEGHLPMAAITDGPVECQSAKVEALGIARWMDPIVLTDTLGEGRAKPHPRAFEIVSEQLGFAGAECIYIGDNPVKDFAGSKGLGWHTLRVRRPRGLRHDLPSDDNVDQEVADLWGLPAMLGVE